MAMELSAIKTTQATGAAPPITVHGASAAGSATGATQDIQQFAAAMQAARDKLNVGGGVAPQAAHRSGMQTTGGGMGQKVFNGLNQLAGSLKTDHQYVSGLINKAMASGNDKMMMKAMLVMGDYQQRVQVVTKTVAKAASSLDSLTRLQ